MTPPASAAPAAAATDMQGSHLIGAATRSDTVRNRAIAAAVTAVTAWGFGPLLVRSIEAPLQAIVFWRVLLAVPVMIGIAYATGGREILRPLRLAALPGLMFGLALPLSFGSFRHTSLVNATMIGSLSPALLLIIGRVLFGDRVAVSRVVGTVGAFVCLLVLLLAGGGTDNRSWTGDLLAIGNLLAWTSYVVLAKRARSTDVHAWSYLAGVFTVMALTVCPWAALTADGKLGALRGTDWLYVAIMVAVTGVIGHGLSTWAIRHLPVSLWSLLGLISPIVSILGAWVWFGQRLNGWQLAGAAGVIGSLVAVMLTDSSAAAAKDSRPT